MKLNKTKSTAAEIVEAHLRDSRSSNLLNDWMLCELLQLLLNKITENGFKQRLCAK